MVKWMVLVKFPLLVGALLIIICFFPLLFGKTLLFGDNYSLMVPGKLFTAHWLTKGIVPLWNPTQFAGISWVGDINQSMFYPSSIFFVLIPPGFALTVTLLSHLLFSFVGAYLLARELSPKLAQLSWILTAIFWSFSPQLVGTLNNLATLQSISYIPWIVLGCLHFSRKSPGSWWQLPILITLQLLGGYPQHVLFSVVFGVTISWVMRDIKFIHRWAGVGMITLMLSAFIWLPFLQTLNQSTRSLQTAEQAQTGSLRIEDLIKIITPTVFDNPALGYKWGPGWSRPTNLVLYFSWIGLLATFRLFFQAKKQNLDKILFGSLLVCLLFSFGDSLPLFNLLQQIPILSSSRGVTPILTIATLVGSLLAGRAVFLMKISASVMKKYFSVVVFMNLLFGLLLISSYFYFDQIWTLANTSLQGALANSLFHTVEKDKILATSILYFFTIQSVFLLVTSWFLYKRKILIVVGVIFIDLIFFTQQYYFFGPSKAYEIPSTMNVVSQVEKALGYNFRMLTRNYNAPYADFGAYADALILRQPFSDSFVDRQELEKFAVALKMKELLSPGWNTPLNLPIINGYTTLLPSAILQDFTDLSVDPGINRLPEISTTDDMTMLQKWSVGYYLVDTWYPSYGEQFPNTIVASGEGWKLYQLPDTLPRIRYESGKPANVDFFAENPNEINLTIETEQPDRLIIADRFDNDWRATVNNQPVEISNFEGMRSVPIDKGENNLHLWYSPRLFYLGLLITSVTVLMLVFSAIIHRFVWQTK